LFFNELIVLKDRLLVEMFPHRFLKAASPAIIQCLHRLSCAAKVLTLVTGGEVSKQKVRSMYGYEGNCNGVCSNLLMCL
jgi:hypothetical protein